MRFGKVRIQMERVLALSFRAREVPVINKLEETKRSVSFHEGIVHILSFDHSLFRFNGSLRFRPR